MNALVTLHSHPDLATRYAATARPRRDRAKTLSSVIAPTAASQAQSAQIQMFPDIVTSSRVIPIQTRRGAEIEPCPRFRSKRRVAVPNSRHHGAQHTDRQRQAEALASSPGRTVTATSPARARRFVTATWSPRHMNHPGTEVR